jgi:phosphohistidine phosphatase SixA
MAQFVKATPQQRAALKQIYAAGNAVLQKYLKENGIAWGQAMHDAKSSVEETRKAGQTKVAQLQAGFDRLQAQQQRPLMAVLTPSQRLAWEEEQLRTAMIKVFSTLTVGHDPATGAMAAKIIGPTEAQAKIIRELSRQAAAKLQALKDPYDPQVRKEALAKLEADIRRRMSAQSIAPAKPGAPIE